MHPIPLHRKDKKKFKNAGQMLAWALQRFHYRRKRGLKISTKDPVAADRFIALVTLMRVAAGHAQAILAACNRSVAESSLVNMHAMLEVWAGFQLIAKDPTGNSMRRAHLAGALALLRKNPDEGLSKRLKSIHGLAFDDATKQVARNPNGHWSGKGRRALIAAECGEQYGQYYELLSWDCHPVVQIALDVHVVDKAGGKLQLGHRDSQHEVATHTCAQATHVLREMWNELVKHEPK